MSENLYQKAKEKIIELEQDWPVDKWIVNDVDVWPLIRIKLYILILNRVEGEVGESVGNNLSKNKKSKPILKRLSKFKLIPALFRAIVGLFSFYLKLKPKKIIFFGSNFHRTIHENLYFNRFFDSMVSAHDLHHSVYMVEFQKVLSNCYNPKAIIPLHKNLDHYKLVNKAFSFKKDSTNYSLDQYEKFYDQLIKDFPDFQKKNLSKNDILKWTSKINSVKFFFIKFFKIVKPEKVILLSSYGFDDLYAVILACKTLNITSVDFQHGPQTNIHMAYSHWTRTPYSGYNILPDEYWCWDIESKQNIEKWSYRTKIIAKEVGHPFVSLLLKRKNNKVGENILFSMQLIPLDEMFTTKFLKFISKTKYFLEVRKHPRNSYKDEKIIDFLISKGLSKSSFNITSSYQKSLPCQNVFCI